MRSIEEIIMLKSKFLLMSFAAVLGSALIGLMLSNSSNAANPEPVVVQVAFVAPISISATNPLEFGSIDVAMPAVAEIIIDPDGGITDIGGWIVGGTQAPAILSVNVTPNRPITILVTETSEGAGYSLQDWLCDYDGSVATVCDVGWNTTSALGGPSDVRVGVKLISDGTAVAGDRDGGFTLGVVYN
jgi:hypothetical protein